ncbi:hypothetical protein LSAT2_033025, partial [Lamellibrachia satsuma]
ETGSLRTNQANGTAEAAVKIAKRLLRKCKVAGEDPYLGLLSVRNTPSEGMMTCPAQHLFGRRTNTLLPVTANKLTPGGPSGVREQYRNQRQKFPSTLNSRFATFECRLNCQNSTDTTW